MCNRWTLCVWQLNITKTMPFFTLSPYHIYRTSSQCLISCGCAITILYVYMYTSTAMFVSVWFSYYHHPTLVHSFLVVGPWRVWPQCRPMPVRLYAQATTWPALLFLYQHSKWVFWILCITRILSYITAIMTAVCVHSPQPSLICAITVYYVSTVADVHVAGHP